MVGDYKQKFSHDRPGSHSNLNFNQCKHLQQFWTVAILVRINAKYVMEDKTAILV